MAKRKREPEKKPVIPSNVYSAILAVSCLAMLVSCAFLYLDWSSYPQGKPKPVSVASRR
jgi:hypothetical protein